jgi:WD40 repeat protein
LLVAAGDRFGGLYVWEAKSGKEFFTLRGHAKAVTTVDWRADSDVLASGSEDGSVRLWDLHTGTAQTNWTAHPDGVLGIAVHPSGAIATAGRDGRVRTWDGSGKNVADFGPAGDVVMKVGFMPDARAVITGDWAGEVRAWPVAGGAGAKLPLPLESRSTRLAVVPVPAPAFPVGATVRTSTSTPETASPQTELARKRSALKAVEDATEKLKEEAARDPKNAALEKAYLQLCEAALAMKTEVLAAEAAARTPPE